MQFFKSMQIAVIAKFYAANSKFANFHDYSAVAIIKIQNTT